MNKKYFLFIGIILVMGIFSGILYYYNIDNNMQSSVINTISNYEINQINNILKHVIILSILLVSSLVLIGIPISLFYVYYEGISMGFIITIFTTKYGLSGFIYGLIYNIVGSLLFLFLLLFFIKKLFYIAFSLMSFIYQKKQEKLKSTIIINFKNALLLMSLIIVLDIIIYIFSDNILLLFAFLLK